MGCCNLVGIRMFSISFGINYKLGIIELKYVLVHTVAQEVFLTKTIFFHKFLTWVGILIVQRYLFWDWLD